MSLSSFLHFVTDSPCSARSDSSFTVFFELLGLCVPFAHFLLCLPLFFFSLWILSPVPLVGLTFHLFWYWLPFCCFYSLSCIFLFSTCSLCLSWAISSFFPMLCVPQCLFVLCDFQFQHSSLFSWFFSPFAFLFTFEYFLSLCLPPPLISCNSLSCMFLFACVCVLLCVFVKGSPNPFQSVQRVSYQNKHCGAVPYARPPCEMIQNQQKVQMSRLELDRRPKSQWDRRPKTQDGIKKPLLEDLWPKRWKCPSTHKDPGLKPIYIRQKAQERQILQD